MRIGSLPGSRSSRGFTLVELLIALLLGTIVVSAAVAYLMKELRGLTSKDVREEVAAAGRYIGISLRHDIRKVGIGIETTTSFGTVDVWPGEQGDVLMVLYVPYLPELAPAHVIVPPPGDENPLPPGSTCGSQCLEVERVTDPLELVRGDLARLQVPGGRRLVLIDQVAAASDMSVELTFTEASTILGQPAGMEGLSLDRFGTFVQKLQPVIYYLDEGNRLMRAERLNLDASYVGSVLAYDVEEFDASLVFADGDELEGADPLDDDETNDYDDVVAVRVRVTVRAKRLHPMVNDGKRYRRSFEWMVAPRNLRYEKNRL